MDYMEHDLATLLMEKVKFSMAQIKYLFAQLLQGVHYLHKEHIIHRDIKCKLNRWECLSRQHWTVEIGRLRTCTKVYSR